MDYLTWREIRDKLNTITDNQVLDEPALFAHTDGYGGETLVPMRFVTDTWHADDKPRTVYYNEGFEQFERLSEAEEEYTPLRQLPRNALLLHYSEMDEDLEQTIDWLKLQHDSTNDLRE